MPKVVIYTASLCPYCHMAKQLLQDKQIAFDEIDVTARSSLRAEMRTKAGGVDTVPQIWIDERHVGGFTELAALDRSGDLDPLFQA